MSPICQQFEKGKHGAMSRRRYYAKSLWVDAMVVLSVISAAGVWAGAGNNAAS